MRWIIIVTFATLAATSLASSPGQPLDCSDWVFLEPGLSCSMVTPFELDGAAGSNPFFRRGTTAVVDNVGDKYIIQTVGEPGGTIEIKLYQLQLVRLTPTGTEVIAYVDEREFVGAGNIGRDHLRPTSDSDTNWNIYQKPAVGSVLSFDPTNGRVPIPLRSYCTSTIGFPCPAVGEYGGGWWIAAIEGFATTFEIFQTYTPTSGPISFRVPYMPEGFQHADYFGTYWGELDTVGDWSKAKPLQCGYPATAPSVGDYLEVEDTLPPLESGQGRYYVTAVTYQGQTRYGRKSSGGVLSGRDPALLPQCLEK